VISFFVEITMILFRIELTNLLTLWTTSTHWTETLPRVAIHPFIGGVRLFIEGVPALTPPIPPRITNIRTRTRFVRRPRLAFLLAELRTKEFHRLVGNRVDLVTMHLGIHPHPVVTALLWVVVKTKVFVIIAWSTLWTTIIKATTTLQFPIPVRRIIGRIPAVLAVIVVVRKTKILGRRRWRVVVWWRCCAHGTTIILIMSTLQHPIPNRNYFERVPTEFADSIGVQKTIILRRIVHVVGWIVNHRYTRVSLLIIC